THPQPTCRGRPPPPPDPPRAGSPPEREGLPLTHATRTRRPRAEWIALALTITWSAHPAPAQVPTNTWTNVASTATEAWSTGSNWSGNVIPSAGPSTILQ